MSLWRRLLYFPVVRYLVKPNSSKRDSQKPAVIVHFKDGTFDSGLLLSSLPTDKIVRYLPRIVNGERRRATRVPFLNEVTIDRLGVRRGVDLSTCGMYVEVLTTYPIGAILPVALRHGAETITVTAKTVFTDPGVGMGLEFQHLPTSTLRQLETWIAQRGKSSDRRGGVRRNSDQQNHDASRQASAPRWDVRRRERRNPALPAASVPIEVEVSRLKSLFFLDNKESPVGSDRPRLSLDKQVIVAFRDGEEIQGTLQDLPPETTGFFIHLPISEDRSHLVYVIKTAVKSIQSIF